MVAASRVVERAARTLRSDPMPTSNQQLRDTFLTPEMAWYFAKKLPELDRSELDMRIEETLKFLNIATYCRGNIPVTQQIDEVWHLWILETCEYERLCGLLQGREFIHHSSTAYITCRGDAPPTPEEELEEKVVALATYVKNYGPFQADRLKYWKFASLLVEDRGWSLEELNAWLLQPGDLKPSRTNG